MMDFQILGPYDPPTGWKEILGELDNSNTAPPSASASGGIIMKYTNTLTFRTSVWALSKAWFFSNTTPLF